MSERSRVGGRLVLAAAAAGMTVAACTSGGDGGPAPLRELPGGAVRLVSFDSCEQALAGLRRAARGVVGPWGFVEQTVGGLALEDSAAGAAGRNSAPQPASPEGADSAPSHSSTNVHEAGVDEPDVVKSDGRRIVTVAGGRLVVVNAATRQIAGTVPLPGEVPPEPYRQPGGAQLLLHGDRALVLLPGFGLVERLPHVQPDVGPGPPGPQPVAGSRLILVDLAARRVLARFSLDGEYIDARQVDGTVRLVARSSPRLGFAYPADPSDERSAIRTNQGLIARSTIADWLPRHEVDVDGARRTERVPCERVSRPASYTGSSMLTVYTLDLAGPADRALDGVEPVTVVADGRTVYGTASSLYVANDLSWRSERPRTELFRFDISGPGPPRLAASGAVPGSLLSQYALSEYDGHLRVATTTSGDRTEQSESAVRVLAERRGRLTVVGRVDGLGKGERIYAVRFIGPVGYVVTFRLVDPLYIVDLSDPRRPRAVGELKVTGYSAYLHPVGDGRLVGVGAEADDQGRREGAQVSLFDVGEPARPVRLDRYLVPGAAAWSVVEQDPHAFLYWPQTGLLSIPVLEPGQGPETIVLSVRDDRLDVVGTVGHDRATGAIHRSLVVGDLLWTLSDHGLQANDVRTLARQAWLPLV
jgi:Beta propeller domain